MASQPPDETAGPSSGVLAQLDQQQEGPRPGSISLTMLIDFIIQRTFHDLTVLAELLPRKTDMERKIEIYNFSARTRQLFIRLLALVKWATSASKVDKSANIMTFLDKQSMMFVETADALSRLSRETMANARLPNFNIPAAIEVLTTGTYSRPPTCIRERILPPEPLSIVEKKQTLHRLNQVIQHRLVTGKLPMQMQNFKIDNGRVQFRVENEFEVGLTMMSDLPDVPWRLLEIDILVTDSEAGNGKELVHIMQIGYIHQLIQARLVDNTDGLVEVYNCLHFFCQSLQLEVLFSQTMNLKQHRLNENVHVEEYVPGTKLSVSYWRELSNKDPRSELGYQLTVQTDPADAARPLAVFHRPSIGSKESSDMADRAVHESLSMERLLVHTVYIRSLARLADIKSEFLKFLKNDSDFTIQGTPAILTVPILQPCLPADQLHVSVDTHTGTLRCHVPKYSKCPVLGEMQIALNGDHSKIADLVGKLRIWMVKRRCERTLEGLAAVSFEHLPLRFEPDHPVTKLSRHRLYVRLNRHPSVILIVEIKECPNSECKVEFAFYLAFVRQCSVEDEAPDSTAKTVSSQADNLPKLFFQINTMVEFDTFVTTHGPATVVVDPPSKKAKISYPSYFVSELAHVVSMCDETLPFLSMASELSDRGISHSGVQCEIDATTLVLRLLMMPQPPSLDSPPDACISPLTWRSLTKRLLSASIRSQVNKNMHSKLWSLDLVFFDSPLRSQRNREQSQRRSVCFTYEMDSSIDIGQTVDGMLRDWASIVYLHRLVCDFACYFDESNDDASNDLINIQNIATIKSYTYTNLLLGYGPNHEVTVNISWNTGFRLTFTGSANNINAHSIMRQHLEAQLNSTHNLAELVRTLHETYYALTSVMRLQIIPHLGIPRPQVPVLSFCILPQSSCLLRVAYQAMYCIEIRICPGGLVCIRDGAHTHFNKTSSVDEFTPTQGLKRFLLNYVDESVIHCRKLKWDDESPHSPVVADENSLPPLRSQSPRDANQRNNTSNAITPGSPITIPTAVVSPLNNMNNSQPRSESPFNASSPATGPNWPGSPGIVRPAPRTDDKTNTTETAQSVTTKGRSWTASVPTLLTNEALETLCFPGPHPQHEVPGPDLCPLERFLGCVYMRRNLQRFIQSEEHLNAIKCETPGVVMFSVDSIQCRIALNTDHMQSLQIQVTQVPIGKDVPVKHSVQWNVDELRTIEEFFEQRVASPPYRPCSLYGFCRMLKAPSQVLRDFIQVICLELQPDLMPDSMWYVQFLVRVPPSSPPIVPTGSAAIHMLRMKTLFFLQITQKQSQDGQLPVSMVLPMVYDVTSNITQLAERRETSGVVPSTNTHAASTLLRRYAEVHAANNNGTEVCSILPAVRELLQNLVLPTDSVGQTAQQVAQSTTDNSLLSVQSAQLVTAIVESSASDTNGTALTTTAIKTNS